MVFMTKKRIQIDSGHNGAVSLQNYFIMWFWHLMDSSEFIFPERILSQIQCLLRELCKFTRSFLVYFRDNCCRPVLLWLLHLLHMAWVGWKGCPDGNHYSVTKLNRVWLCSQTNQTETNILHIALSALWSVPLHFCTENRSVKVCRSSTTFNQEVTPSCTKASWG